VSCWLDIRRGAVVLALGLSTAALAGCKATDDAFCTSAGCEWTQAEWARLSLLSPNPFPEPPDDPSNRYAALDYPQRDKVLELGQRFYFDKSFSAVAPSSTGPVDAIDRPVPYGRAPVACADCHDPKRGGTDVTSAPNHVSIGAGWYDVNSEQTVNIAYAKLLYWNGRTDSIWAQAAQVTESKFSVNGNRNGVFWTIWNNATYRALYNEAFPDAPLPATAPDTTAVPLSAKPAAAPATPNAAWDGMTLENKQLVTRVLVNFAKAIAAYEATLISKESPFDRFVGGDATAISPAAKRGARLFVGKASCVDCHNGPMLSDGAFHDIGVPQTGEHVPTIADCFPKIPACDCTPGAEGKSCLPAGAWSGRLKLAARPTDTEPVYDGAMTAADRVALDIPYFSTFSRDSVWSDDVYDDSRQPYYANPNESPEGQLLKGAWRTPSLRDVALTAPYMHDGFYKTLEDVVWHYNNGGAPGAKSAFALPPCAPGQTSDPANGTPCADPTLPVPALAVQFKPLGLSDDEVSDLVEFLKSLTGKMLPASQITALPPPAVDGGATTDAGTPPVDAATSDAATSDGSASLTDGGGSQ
jgi:cytochrome c peroxidase